jgi:hypothetical protein
VARQLCTVQTQALYVLFTGSTIIRHQIAKQHEILWCHILPYLEAELSGQFGSFNPQLSFVNLQDHTVLLYFTF